jgi:hypothetical protein
MHTFTRLTVTMAATQTVAWPHFAGSTLRGAFGRALRKAACITGQDKCTGCPLRSSCAYGVVFDPAAPAQPLHPSFKDGLPRYLMQPPALGTCQLSAGQTQHFSLLLLPGTQAHHRLIGHTLRNAVEKELLQPGLFQLLDIQTQQVPVSASHANDSTAPAMGPTAKGLSTNKAQMTLHWQTPLRLQNKGKPIFKAQLLDATTLVRALLRRQLQWCQLSEQVAPDPQAQLQAAYACKIDTQRMQWHDMARFSSTQNEKLPLGGLLGTTTLTGPTHALQALLPLLQLGEQLSIGKETVMGMGSYKLSA